MMQSLLIVVGWTPSLRKLFRKLKWHWEIHLIYSIYISLQTLWEKRRENALRMLKYSEESFLVYSYGSLSSHSENMTFSSRKPLGPALNIHHCFIWNILRLPGMTRSASQTASTLKTWDAITNKLRWKVSLKNKTMNSIGAAMALVISLDKDLFGSSH